MFQELAKKSMELQIIQDLENLNRKIYCYNEMSMHTEPEDDFQKKFMDLKKTIIIVSTKKLQK